MSKLIIIHAQPGNAARAHITGGWELTSHIPPTSQASPLAIAECVPLWQCILIQVLKMGLHPALHPVEHLPVAMYASAQWCRDLFLQDTHLPLTALCGLHKDVLAWARGTKYYPHVRSPSVGSYIKLQ